ncbi:MAG: endolytic transglycosylase MltG [Minisyncoccota bacterium]
MKEVLKDWRLYVFGGLFLFNFIYVLAFSVPSNYPEGSIITLEKGAGLAELSKELERSNVVRSALWFRIAAITFGGETGIQAGDYSLKGRDNAITLAWRMVNGNHGLILEKITIPEGFTIDKILGLFDERFTSFDHEAFKLLAREGYMFPDTYFLQMNITASSSIELFKNNYEKKVAKYRNAIVSSGFTEDEIITLASIIEAEVQTPEDKELVSGILHKRLKMNMALQVDPAPETYEAPGLPDAPINNPGLISINAALNPKKSSYLYFLSGKDGKTYYADTLEEHITNIQKYL